jgi:hypothetical protein
MNSVFMKLFNVIFFSYPLYCYLEGLNNSTGSSNALVIIYILRHCNPQNPDSNVLKMPDAGPNRR